MKLKEKKGRFGQLDRLKEKAVSVLRFLDQWQSDSDCLKLYYDANYGLWTIHPLAWSGEKKNKWQERFQGNCHYARPLKQEVDIFCACHEYLSVKYENKSFLEKKRKNTGGVTFDL